MTSESLSTPNGASLTRQIARARETFGLDLSDLVVLTEAASGWFGLTPILALLAGAKEVIAVGRDSRYATFSEVEAHITDLGERCNVHGDLRIVGSKRPEDISRTDIVTNLGFVRPIDAATVSQMKPTAAVPLMWEPWEYRPEDIDLAACEESGIPVLGTDEQTPNLRTFEYVGVLALKLLLEAQVEVLMSRIVVLGSGPFGKRTVERLRALGATVLWVNPRLESGTDNARGLLTSESLGTSQTRGFLEEADALVVVEHHTREPLIGRNGAMTFDELKGINSGLAVIHICGEVDRDGLGHSGLRYAPRTLQPGGSMSVTTAEVGPRPLIDLHTAGLRVGEVLTRARLSGASVEDARAIAIASTPAKDFTKTDYNGTTSRPTIQSSGGRQT